MHAACQQFPRLPSRTAIQAVIQAVNEFVSDGDFYAAAPPSWLLLSIMLIYLNCVLVGVNCVLVGVNCVLVCVNCVLVGVNCVLVGVNCVLVGVNCVLPSP
jgi:hypothetical protein